MKRILFLSLAIWLWLPVRVAKADAVGLRLAPLKYEQTITSSKPQTGFIDVSNPSDANVDITTSVQGFRQPGTDGSLSYYDNPALATAITPNLAAFTLGPREAIRVTFTIDPAKLPMGGIYAVIFFRTIPPAGIANSSFVSQSARVGTLLILNNGDAVSGSGILSAKLPWLQLGNAVTGQVTFTEPAGYIGITPKLSTQLYPWGKTTQFTTGLVLPGATRHFDFKRQGSYFGLIPVKITGDNEETTTAWTFVITGWYQTLIALLIAFLVAHWLRRNRRPRLLEVVKRPLDGLSG